MCLEVTADLSGGRTPGPIAHRTATLLWGLCVGIVEDIVGNMRWIYILYIYVPLDTRSQNQNNYLFTLPNKGVRMCHQLTVRGRNSYCLCCNRFWKVPSSVFMRKWDDY